jgi:hypothetical protein
MADECPIHTWPWSSAFHVFPSCHDSLQVTVFAKVHHAYEDEHYPIIVLAVIFPRVKSCCTQQLVEGSDREEKGRLRDLDKNVPRAAL